MSSVEIEFVAFASSDEIFGMPQRSPLSSQSVVGSSSDSMACGVPALLKGAFHRAAVQYLQEASQGPSLAAGLRVSLLAGGGFEPADVSEEEVVPTRNIAAATRIAPTTALCPLFMCVFSLREITLLKTCQGARARSFNRKAAPVSYLSWTARRSDSQWARENRHKCVPIEWSRGKSVAQVLDRAYGSDRTAQHRFCGRALLPRDVMLAAEYSRKIDSLTSKRVAKS
jgi:hypothetical protein